MKIESLVGAHVSISGGLDQAPERGMEIGGTAIQIFTKNQVQWKTKPLLNDEIGKFRHSLAQSGIRSILAHDSYLINLGSPEKNLLEKSRAAFLDEMKRAEDLQIPSLIFHPGSHKDAGEEVGIRLIAESLNYAHLQCPDFQVKLLLETTAGQGTSLGHNFEQLQKIIEIVSQPERVGICLDTCHIFAAGYDIRARSSYDQTFNKFDEVIGLDKLYAIHLNDSLKGLGSRIDRHANIGEGQIGLNGFRLIMNDARFVNIPKVLETPGNSLSFKKNLDLLKNLIEKN